MISKNSQDGQDGNKGGELGRAGRQGQHRGLGHQAEEQAFSSRAVGSHRGCGNRRGSRFSLVDLYVHSSVLDTTISGCVLIHAPAKCQTHYYLIFILSRHFFPHLNTFI